MSTDTDRPVYQRFYSFAMPSPAILGLNEPPTASRLKFWFVPRGYFAQKSQSLVFHNSFGWKIAIFFFHFIVIGADCLIEWDRKIFSESQLTLIEGKHCCAAMFDGKLSTSIYDSRLCGGKSRRRSQFASTISVEHNAFFVFAFESRAWDLLFQFVSKRRRGAVKLRQTKLCN